MFYCKRQETTKYDVEELIEHLMHAKSIPMESLTDHSYTVESFKFQFSWIVGLLVIPGDIILWML